ncbi:hypothetical protein [Myxosarcina sp. GI1]|uniref:hypothetical protein n=1 Tax=Myxosarcina sp. GI1 TaxID=1541065 RepID=UPI00055A7EC7|nr:hypothetical protein [Myxosarcina sp. GI1]
MDKIFTSDRETKRLLMQVGMPEDVVDNLFKTFRKLVTNPKGYVATANITRQLVANCFTHEHLLNNTVDKAKMAVLGNLVKMPHIPWYWLAEELASDLVKTDPPESIPQDIILPDAGIIMLPKNLISTSTGEINFLAYKLFRQGENSVIPTVSRDMNTNKLTKGTGETKFVGEAGERLCWTSLQEGYTYGGIVGLIPHENEYRIHHLEAVVMADAELERKEVNLMTAVILSSLVYASQNESDIVHATSGSGFGNSKDNNRQSKYSQPLFIGKDYKSPLRSASIGSGKSGKGTSKRIHFRRGHWRRIAYGEGRTKRRWQLFAPQLIGANKQK